MTEPFPPMIDRQAMDSKFSISTLLAALPGLDSGAGGGEFVGHELSTWKPGHYLVFFLLVMGGTWTCVRFGASWRLIVRSSRPLPINIESKTPLHSIHTVSELLDWFCFFVCERVLRLPFIPNTGKHLDDENLTIRDHLCMAFNRSLSSCGWFFFVSPPGIIERGIVATF